MDLLVDLGNSRIKWALAAPTGWEAGAAASDDIDDDARLAQLWRDYSPRRVVIASVAPSARLARLLAWIDGRWRVPAYSVHPRREGFGVRNGYRAPERLGSDRWAALVAVRRMTPKAAVVVGAGTALTIDALSSDGEFLGGVIFPGLRLARRCVVASTAGVEAGDGDASSCCARATADGLAAGTVFGLVGAIERVFAEQDRLLGGDAQAYITGGDAPVLLPRLSIDATHVPDLVLRGLAVIAEELP